MGSGTERKLRPPGLPSWVVARPRLDALLQDCFNRFDVVEVAAAPGAGKTVAAQLFAARFGSPTAWLNIDSADRSGTRLLVYIARALAPFDSMAPQIVEDALRVGLTAPEAAAVLAENLTSATLLLVVDNCEEIRDTPEAVGVLTALLTYVPAITRVLLLSREPLDPIIARIGLDGRVARIDDTDLAFVVEEARLLLAAAGRSQAEAVGLVEATRGWVAGMVFEGQLTGSRGPNDMAEYLNNEILSRLTPAEQDFLLRTSMLGAVTSAAARELCGPQGPALLSGILRRHLPATRGPDGALIYHPCFRQFLVEQLEQRLPGESAELRRRHAHALSIHGDYEEAVEILLAVGALEDAASVSESAVDTLCQRADWPLLMTWFERLGNELVQANPRLLGAKIRALTHGRRVPEAQTLIRDLHRRGLISRVADVDPGIVAHIGWAFMWRPIEGLAIMGDYPCDHRAEAVRYTLRVTSGREPAAPPPGADFGDVERVLTWGLFVQGRLDLLAGLLPTAKQWPPSGFYRTPHPLLSLLWHGDLDMVHGRWDQVPLEVRQRSHTDLWHNLEAWILIAEGDAEGALRAGQEAVAHSLRTRFGWEPYFQLVVALALIRLCRLEDARSVLADSLARSAAVGQHAYVEWAQTYLGLAQLLAGASGAALHTLRECVDSMQAAGRRLILPAALAYLSEAEARAGTTGRAGELAALALRSADDFGALFPLHQAIVDFPGVLERSAGEPSSLAPTRSSPIEAAQSISILDLSHHVDVHPFGQRPDIWVDGARCGVRRLKVIELAAYLALHGGTVDRQQIQLDLFPDHDQRTGGNYFRQITHQFRRATGVPLVRWDSHSVGLPAGSVLTSADVMLERLLSGRPARQDTLDEVLALLDQIEGGYLAASSFSWAEQRRFELEVLQTKMLKDYALLALELERLDDAELLADRALSADPYCEEAFQVLFAAAERMGSPERCDIVYRRARSALAEVGVEPEDIGLAGDRASPARASAARPSLPRNDS